MFKKIRRIIYVLIALLAIYKGVTIYQSVKRVLAYRPLVEKVLAEDDNDTNEDLVLAVIYTETKGQDDDVMQSSESSTGTTKSIRDNKESIKQGTRVLAQNLEKAQAAKTDSWTAVQAYNFGTNYINYVSERGGKNTIQLAKAYSKDVVAPSLGNKTGKTYYHINPVSILYGGGKLYVDGGNHYYAKQVQFSLFLIRLVDRL
ncbi:lysozyme family protein [Streptococcus sobrinus]|uniref:Pneumococcal vaccine antigen A family protein n=4 Tax=Streptococcus sobrinus TaxID=1310 RepID=U2KAW6_9STRE|nr:lysozyme family protein [Streptococcus sobrinus]AWN18872.1 lysozyme family protein [Streptococcus sobrinus]AWN61659.1 lysozyme family protein [Streptococcus sobrinus]AWN63530.1 lysozyme family protein [Streptococcus sobrinus]ERJ74314.1 pneumococcal vaccine antigen A family protein [Streptococcus sobrinus W1703]SQG20079.1 transposon-like protein [Streptococcus sobrinus]